MDSIKEIIPRVVQDLSEHKPQAETRLDHFWAKLCEGKAAKHTKVFGIKGVKLLILVDSPVWLFHLSMQKRKILEELTDQFPEISEVAFKIGKVT